ncbi:MAG: HNH endonuclease [Myxococcales bacterium]|nr:HNH endonuclease [Myxococcales bacterium]
MRTHVVRLELSADTFALLRQARQVLDNEHGTSLSEDELVAQLCNAVLDGAAPGAPTGRAKFQVALTVCERCQQGWQHGAGAKIPIGAAAVERAMCDAQHIGSIDGDVPARAYQDVSPSVARFVWHRDAGRCRVPGCRSSRGLELHHLVHRADGGGHDASNIALLCSACHLSHHAGTLQITGTAHQMEVVRRAHPHHRAPTSQVANTGAHVGTDPAHDEDSARAPTSQLANAGSREATGMRADGAHDEGDERSMRATMGQVGNTGAHVTTTPPPDESRDRLVSGRGTQGGAGPMPAMASGLTELCGEATLALKQLGWRPAVAQAAARAAASMLGADATLERVVVEALRRCPLPPGTASPTSHRDGRV